MNASYPLSVHEAGHDATMCVDGTLLWIGDRRSAAFAEAYDFCETHVAQIAPRPSLADALSRRPSDVKRIVVAQTTRSPDASSAPDRLGDAYPDASIMQIRGPLSTGLSRRRDGTVIQHNWDQWNQVLPTWLGLEPARFDTIHSVAVVAKSIVDAEPLLDLADDEGVAAMWCRQVDPIGIRGVDAVWWDDSVALACDVSTWRDRIAAFSSARHHAWLVSAPGGDGIARARRGGIDSVLTKPFLIDSLVGGLRGPATSAVTGRAA